MSSNFFFFIAFCRGTPPAVRGRVCIDLELLRVNVVSTCESCFQTWFLPFVLRFYVRWNWRKLETGEERFLETWLWWTQKRYQLWFPQLFLLTFHSVFGVYSELYFTARSFGIFWNKNILRNIFRLFSSWVQNSRNGNPCIPEWE